jgi:hypothetical protein
VPLIPHLIPVRDPLPATPSPSVANQSLFSTYDIAIGGLGFRLASDSTKPMIRETAPYVRQQIDQGSEAGEQTLTNWWVKSQSSFHGGAGNLNLERTDLPAEYTHVRYDTGIGVDPWTSGKLMRLPDTTRTSLGFTGSKMVTASVAGIDHAIVGGVGGLAQVKWTGGADVAPTVTNIDLTTSTFGGAANCTVTSLATDGQNYFAVIQLTTVGFISGTLTLIVSGLVSSTAAPTVIYQCPNPTTLTSRTNLCTNPAFETNATSWSGSGTPAPTVAQSAVQAHSGTKSLLVTSTGAATLLPNALYTLTTVASTTYTVSAWVFVPAGNPAVQVFASAAPTVFGTSTTTTNAWQRVSVTFTASSASTGINFWSNFTGVGQTFFIDDVLIEASSTVGTYFDGSTTATSSYTFAWSGVANGSTSTATPIVTPQQIPSIVGWSKERLVGCVGQKLYELNSNAAPLSVLPTAKYTHPTPGWTWTDISEAPAGVLASGYAGGQSSVLQFGLDANGGVPTLTGGTTVASTPAGEIIWSLKALMASFIIFGTQRGVRVATFDTYTGALKYGPLPFTSTQPVLALTGRDRFVYGSYTNQQADGKTGLFRLDLSLTTDQNGRNAWAPDLRPPTTAPTGLGSVTAAGLLPTGNRVIFLTPEGVHSEGNGPGSDGTAWLQTSRIRFGTTEPKLFKLGRIRGDLSAGSVRIESITRATSTVSGLTGFVTTEPDEVGLPPGPQEWLALKFTLTGAPVVLASYGVKALPGTPRQRLIQVTCSVADRESDRRGHRNVDLGSARSRVDALEALDAAGDQVLFEEFGIFGNKRTVVVIEKVSFEETARPTNQSDFGGQVTVTMRTVA